MHNISEHPRTISPTFQPHSSISSTAAAGANQAVAQQAQLSAASGPYAAPGEDKLRQAFQSFVGETFYGQLLSAMRKTVGKPAYLHGGRAEEVFQGQLDQMLSEQMSEASAESFSGPMFELFQLERR